MLYEVITDRIVILGAGESGTGSAILAKQQGFDVFVSDSGSINQRYREMLDEHKILYESGGHTERQILNADEVIKSPGIPESAPLVKQLRNVITSYSIHYTKLYEG